MTHKVSSSHFRGPGFVQRLAKKIQGQFRVTYSVAVERANAALGIDVVVLDAALAARAAERAKAAPKSEPEAKPASEPKAKSKGKLKSERAEELEGHTVAELVEFARKSEFEGYSGLNKAELIAFIIDAEEEQA